MKSLYKPARKNLFKLKIEEVTKILHDLKINGNKKIGEIWKFLWSKNNLFKPEEDHYKPTRIGNAFSSKYIEDKSNGDKEKSLSIKKNLDMIRPYFSDIINDHKTQGMENSFNSDN